MKKLSVALSIACLVSVGGAAAKEGGPLSGVFATSPQHCDLVAKRGSRAVFDTETLIFTMKDGIIGNEYFCDFARVDYLFDGEAAVATAYCQEPGFTFPDLFSISVYNETQIELISTYFSASGPVDDDRSGQFLFTRCDQIKELKID